MSVLSSDGVLPVKKAHFGVFLHNLVRVILGVCTHRVGDGLAIPHPPPTR